MNYHDITPGQVRKLAESTVSPAISIYIPTSRTGLDVLQGRPILKNFLVEAEKRLTESGMRHTLALDFLAEATKLCNDEAFWNDRLDAVAIFISPGSTDAYHLPFSTPQLMRIGSHFHIRPLLGALTNRKSYYALALEKNDVRLVHCTARGAHSVDVENMPRSFKEFVGMDYSEKQSQSHSVGPVGMAGTSISHGAGDKGADPKDQLHRFTTAIARAVEKRLANSHEPLVLLGTEEVLDTYRAVNNYGQLLEKGVAGSPKMFDEEAVRAATITIAEEAMDRSRQAQLERYREYAGTGLSSQQIDDILPAATTGKIDVLLANDERHVWGTFDDETGCATLHSTEWEGDEDLVNLATIETLKNSGTVYTVEPSEMNWQDGVAAIYRY